ncbi:MAG: DNA topoisomerase IB [Verrucomicrobiia bacterium]
MQTRRQVPVAALIDPVQSAKAAGLRYVNGEIPGIRRQKAGESFRYLAPNGKPVADPEELRRIRSLAIPPAWTDVWICPIPNGHLQATGHDIRGRKQYRYHPNWRSVRDETKYNRMIDFGRVLPRIRERVEADLQRPGLPKEKVLATVVRLLEVSLIRVGNEEYARDNKSFGLTTLRDQHVEVAGSKVHFQFRGKSGKQHAVLVDDPRLARIVKRCQDIPGQELFQYVDDDEQAQTVDSSDVNAYLKDITGQDFTAKDFRTWAGTVLAARALREFEQVDSQARAKKNILRAIEAVAQMLGNTPSICRKCYVHPAVLNAYLDGALLTTLRRRAQERLSSSLAGLRPEEAAVLAFLQKQLAAEMSGRNGSPNGRSLKANGASKAQSRAMKPAGTRKGRRGRGKAWQPAAVPSSWRS